MMMEVDIHVCAPLCFFYFLAACPEVITHFVVAGAPPSVVSSSSLYSIR
jgi:hypothetical protein